MRKKTSLVLALTLTALLLFTGCASAEELQERYDQMVTGNVDLETAGEMGDFLDRYLKRFDGQTANRMVLDLENYLTKYITANPDKVSLEGAAAYFDKEEGEFDEDGLKKSEYRRFVEDLENAHLKAVWYEDALRLKVDYEDILEEYGEELTEPVRSLLALQSLAVEEPMMENAVLQISWEKVLDRAYTAETLLKQFGEEELIRTDALELYKLYLNTLLMGTTNSPIIDYKTGVFSEGAKTIYKDFLLDHPDSTISWVLNEYFTYLEKVSYTVNYSNGNESKVFFDTCDWLVSQAEKRVTQ